MESREQHTITVDDDETKLVIVLEEREERLRLKAVLASVAEDVDGAEWLEGNLELLFGMSVLHEDDTAEDDETVDGDVLVQLQLLSGRSDSRNDGLACLTRLDGLSARQFLRQERHMLI